VFATTEIRKVPVTVLSRCQRFDLRRVEAGTLVSHLASVAAGEEIETEPEALALIARAAEGSVRDSLSLLDQAIAHAAGPVRAEHVRQMLGLADRARVIDLFESLMSGDVAAALTELRAQYDTGADPVVVLGDLAEFTHFVTRVKIVPAVADDPALIEVERTRGRAFAEKLSMRVLARTWQMLLKGIAEVKEASRPVAAAEMVLVRIAYAADLPTPDEVVRSLADGNGSAVAGSRSAPAAASATGIAMSTAMREPSTTAPSTPTASLSPRGAPRAALAPVLQPATDPAATPAEPPVAVRSFDELVALAAKNRDIGIKAALERDVRLVRFEDGRLEIALEPSAPKTLVHDLSRKFSQWTNRRWMVIVSAEAGEPTLKSRLDARRAELKTGVQADPLVAAVLARFPGAEIVEVRPAEVARAAVRADDNAAPETGGGDDDIVEFPADMRPDDADDDF
jgi:DNA polymerase-3 subunit gamma/tau